MNYLSGRCRENRPIKPECPVRVPGDQAARGITTSLHAGIAYAATDWAAIERCAQEMDVPPPLRIGDVASNKA